MNVLKRIFLTAVLLATASSSVVLSDATKVSAWAYNVNNQYTAPYINYPSVITIGNPENQYVRAYGYTRNRIDKSGEHHVRAIQCFLNVSVDGNIGPITDSAIKAYQNANNLYADGIVGQDTYRYLMYDNSIVGYIYNTGNANISFISNPDVICYGK